MYYQNNNYNYESQQQLYVSLPQNEEYLGQGDIQFEEQKNNLILTQEIDFHFPDQQVEQSAFLNDQISQNYDQHSYFQMNSQEYDNQIQQQQPYNDSEQMNSDQNQFNFSQKFKDLTSSDNYSNIRINQNSEKSSIYSKKRSRKQKIGIKAFQCSKCKKEYQNKCSLLSHIRMKHPNDESTEAICEIKNQTNRGRPTKENIRERNPWEYSDEEEIYFTQKKKKLDPCEKRQLLQIILLQFRDDLIQKSLIPILQNQQKQNLSTKIFSEELLSQYGENYIQIQKDQYNYIVFGNKEKQELEQILQQLRENSNIDEELEHLKKDQGFFQSILHIIFDTAIRNFRKEYRKLALYIMLIAFISPEQQDYQILKNLLKNQLNLTMIKSFIESFRKQFFYFLENNEFIRSYLSKNPLKFPLPQENIFF